jgi:SAM-dependent methyltransferase
LVLDIGTSRRFDKEMFFFRDLFADNYKAVAYKSQDGACDYESDILDLEFDDDSIDAVICFEVLEHVINPFRAISEVYRILKPGGIVLLSVPFLTSYHGISNNINESSQNNYSDFFRFTHQGVELLLQRFEKVEIVPAGGPIDYRLSLINFHNSSLYKTGFIQRVLKLIDRPVLGKSSVRHFGWGTK